MEGTRRDPEQTAQEQHRVGLAAPIAEPDREAARDGLILARCGPVFALRRSVFFFR
jgi:hypothetical protein